MHHVCTYVPTAPSMAHPACRPKPIRTLKSCVPSKKANGMEDEKRRKKGRRRERWVERVEKRKANERWCDEIRKESERRNAKRRGQTRNKTKRE